eukprot:TRINITY_DN3497_c0_g1_i15.p1 TRINITY_DN3497_c0_g1~~TRINITY_DN3497_c0_g1_i15.p1  ORF type:complete len:256 (-),score=15.99 TRINITY_DN3497_c0_g1_i15:161-928(-)
MRAGNNEYPYNCPICFRFFKNMLKSECCGNYMCHLCVEDYNDQLQKEVTKRAVCCFCAKSNLVYVDVDPHDNVKHYTDSPMNTFNFHSKTLSKMLLNKDSVESLRDSKRDPGKAYQISNFRRDFRAGTQIPSQNIGEEESASYVPRFAASDNELALRRLYDPLNRAIHGEVVDYTKEEIKVDISQPVEASKILNSQSSDMNHRVNFTVQGSENLAHSNNPVNQVIEEQTPGQSHRTTPGMVITLGFGRVPRTNTS